MHQVSQQDGLADPDANFDQGSDIDPTGLTNSELMAIQKQTADELDGHAMIGHDMSGVDNMDADLVGGADGDGDGDEEDEDVIDVDNPEDLARKGLRKIQIEGDDEQEYLMDNDGNIYDLQGNFIGTTGGDDEEDGGDGDQEE